MNFVERFHGFIRSLAEACTEGDLIEVRRLLEEGRSINETSDSGETLLSLACASGYYELAQVGVLSFFAICSCNMSIYKFMHVLLNADALSHARQRRRPRNQG